MTVAGAVLAGTLVAAVSAEVIGPAGLVVVGVLAAVVAFLVLTLRAPGAASNLGSDAAAGSQAPPVDRPRRPVPVTVSPAPSPASTPVRSRDRDVATFLGRRGQALVARQLELLGVATADPYPEELMRLAFRLRRNAESLLIASGAEPPQRWSRPVAALDAARIAGGDSEVGDRVRFDVFPETWIAPSTVGAVIHVLAELLDHAARSSPPDAVVVVSASFDHHHDLVIWVEDRGMGLGRDELDRANLLLSGLEPEGVVTAVGLGHLLAGRLAARTGLVATLDSAGHGLVATLAVPAAALEVAPPPGAATGSPRRRASARSANGDARTRSAEDSVSHAAADSIDEPGDDDDGRWALRSTSRPRPRASRPPSSSRPASRPQTPPAPPASEPPAVATGDGAGTTTTGLQRRVPGASRGEHQAGDAPIGAFRRKRGRGRAALGPPANPAEGDGGGDTAADADVERSAAARRQRLDGYIAGRATAEALADSDAGGPADDAAGQSNGDEEQA